MTKNPPANAEDTGLTLGLGIFHVPWGDEAPCGATTESALQSLQTAASKAHAPRRCALQQENPHNKRPTLSHAGSAQPKLNK